MNVFALGHLRHQMIHEVQKLQSALLPGDLRVDRSGSDFQGGKQIQRPMALVGALEPADDCAIVGLHVPSRPLQRLDAGFLVYG